MLKSESLNVWRGRLLRYAPLILWIGVVLFASTTTGSMSNTSLIIRPLLEFFCPNSSEETLFNYHFYIRKTAHLTEYGILALLASRAFSSSSLKLLKKYWFLAAFVLAVSVASFDEYNQSFEPARTSSFYDVLLDATGATSAIVIFCIYKLSRKNKSY